MISNKKKNYAEHLLKLVLALSLLRTDPENYLEWGLESRLSLGNVGILELRAAPLTDYPYANRKALMPLIEDLAARFDPVPFDVQAYLFTHSSEQFPTLDQPVPDNSTTTTTVRNSTTAGGGTAETENEDVFLNPDIFTESTSIIEQNLADLNEFANEGATYTNLKEEPAEPSVFDLFKCERTACEPEDPDYGSWTAPSPDDDEDNGLGGVIQWDEYFGLKNEIDESLLAVKLEAENQENLQHALNSTDPELDNDPIVIQRDPVTAELTQEVSENLAFSIYGLS